MKNPRLKRNRVCTVPTTPVCRTAGSCMIMVSVFFVETMEKISALESELARLKAQIAVYALSEVSNIPTGTFTLSFHMHNL